MSPASLRIAALRSYAEGNALSELPQDDLTTAQEIAALLPALDSLLGRVRRGRKLPARTLERLATQVGNIDFAALEAAGFVPTEAWTCAERLAEIGDALAENFNGPELRREHLPAAPEEFAALCRVLALYAHPRLPQLLRAVADQPALHGGTGWTAMFQAWGRSSADSPERLLALSDALAGLRVGRSLRQSYLGYANALAAAGLYAGTERLHPFDSALGERALSEALTGDSESAAVAAVTALAFLSPERRERLLPPAEAHPAPRVQLEVNYARAKAGEGGLDELLAAARTPELEARASEYLAGLGRADLLDPTWETPDGQARRQILAWLSRPESFGRAPDTLEVLPPVTLFWPPSGQSQALRVFRYRYGEQVGQGLQGGVLAALGVADGGRSTADLSPADVLALHCSWEMAEQESRAGFSVADGWARLGEHNPQFEPPKKGFLARLRGR